MHPTSYNTGAYVRVFRHAPSLGLPGLTDLNLTGVIKQRFPNLPFTPGTAFNHTVLVRSNTSAFFNRRRVVNARPTGPFNRPVYGGVRGVGRALRRTNCRIHCCAKASNGHLLVIGRTYAITSGIRYSPKRTFGIATTVSGLSFRRRLGVNRLIHDISIIPHIVAFNKQNIRLRGLLSTVRRRNSCVNIGTPTDNICGGSCRYVRVNCNISPRIRVPAVLNGDNLPIFLLKGITSIIAGGCKADVPVISATDILGHALRVIRRRRATFVYAGMRRASLYNRHRGITTCTSHLHMTSR